MVCMPKNMKMFDDNNEPVDTCPTCGAEITGISEVFRADGKKISSNYSYDDSNINQKEHKFSLSDEKSKT